MFLMAYDSFLGLSFFTSCYVTTRSSNRRKFNYFRHALVATGGRGSENGAQFEATVFGNRYLSSCFLYTLCNLALSRHMYNVGRDESDVDGGADDPAFSCL